MEIEKDKYGSEPLSNFDLIKAVSKELKDRVNIVDTTKLNGNEDLERDIFKGRGHIIVFLENPGQDVGHWVGLVRSGKGKNSKILYLDSYGDPLENEQLKNIIKQKYKTLYYNKFPFQQEDTNVCGRYALILAGLNKIIPNLTMKDVVEFFKNSKPKNKSYDQHVIDLTKDI